jgi:hypothetical protein
MSPRSRLRQLEHLVEKLTAPPVGAGVVEFDRDGNLFSTGRLIAELPPGGCLLVPIPRTSVDEWEQSGND